MFLRGTYVALAIALLGCTKVEIPDEIKKFQEDFKTVVDSRPKPPGPRFTDNDSQAETPSQLTGLQSEHTFDEVDPGLSKADYLEAEREWMEDVEACASLVHGLRMDTQTGTENGACIYKSKINGVDRWCTLDHLEDCQLALKDEDEK